MTISQSKPVTFPALADLQAGLDLVRMSPPDAGTVEMIVRRPRVEAREVMDQCQLDALEGLVGDRWQLSAGFPKSGRRPDPATQLTIMNSRAIQLVAGEKTRWPLAGDQFFIDLDLSLSNLPAGTRLKLGSAIVEISAEPHTGCKKFTARFGLDALRFVNSETGRQLNLRGVNARIIQGGLVRVGDLATKC